MLVGALADAGADQKAIADAVHSLDAGATVSFEKVKRCGIGATKYHVATAETKTHRHLSHIVKMIEKANLSEAARRNAIAIFRKLGDHVTFSMSERLTRFRRSSNWICMSVLGFPPRQSITCSGSATPSAFESADDNVIPVIPCATASSSINRRNHREVWR